VLPSHTKWRGVGLGAVCDHYVIAQYPFSRVPVCVAVFILHESNREGQTCKSAVGKVWLYDLELLQVAQTSIRAAILLMEAWLLFWLKS
jgi:hypothetical protein